MQARWIIGAACAMAALIALGGCEMFVTPPANLAESHGEECIMLTTALEKLADDWRTNPGGPRLQIDAYAISANRIEPGYASKESGLLLPKDTRPVDIADCGTPLSTIANRLEVVWPAHEIPTGDRKSCWRTDGGWVSRAAIDAEQNHAVVLYTDDVCGERYWLLRLSKDARGVWYADAPDPLKREPVVPLQGD